MMPDSLYSEINDLARYIEHGTQYRIMDLAITALKAKYTHIHRTQFKAYEGNTSTRSLYLYDKTAREIRDISDGVRFSNRSDIIGLAVLAFKEKYQIGDIKRPSLTDLIS